MNIEQLIKAMTPEIYENMKTAVEIGKWPDGTPLTGEQKETTIQAVMLYDARHSGEHNEPFRIKADGSVQLGKEKASSDFAKQGQVIFKSSANEKD